MDIKGVFIPTARQILMPTIPEHINLSTGTDKTKNTSDDVDEEYYALHKFLGMIGKGDMVATEMLFATNMITNYAMSIQRQGSQIWDHIFKNREKILSRECKGFVGYVQRQANTYSVRGDRLNEVNETIKFLNNLITQDEWPSLKKLSDVPDIRNKILNFCINKKHTSWELTTVNGKDFFHLVCCDRKVPDTVTFKTANEIYQNVAKAYGNRAIAAAANEGRDWKAISHAVRVGEEAIELLTTGKIIFPRPNAKYLVDIKVGNVEYSKVSDQLDQLLASVNESVNNSVLPEKPDYQFMEDFYISVYGDVILRSNGEYGNG